MLLGETLRDERREKGLCVNRGGEQLGWGSQRVPGVRAGVSDSSVCTQALSVCRGRPCARALC